MIKTLTPYYVTIPLVNPLTDVVCDSYTIKVFIWAGNKTAVPSLPEYEITKVNAASANGNEKVNISRIVNDFIDFNFEQSLVTSLENSNNQVWVQFYVLYSDQPTVPQLQFLQLAVKGYGYFLEGENPDVPTNKILLNINDYKVNRNGFFVLPIQLEETAAPLPSITINDVTDIGGGEFEVDFSSVGTYVSLNLRTHRVGEDPELDIVFSYDPTSPIVILFAPEDGETYEFTLTGFDIESATDVTSNVFTLTV